MLLYLDEGIIERLKEEKVQNAINNIGYSIKNRMHILYSERSVLEKLYKSENLSEETRRIFKNLFNRSVEMKLYMSYTNSYIKICGEQNIISNKFENDKNQIIVSIDYFEEITLLNEVIILLENMKDYDVYKKIAEYFIYVNKLNNVGIRFNDMTGGGSGISDAFSRKLSNNKYSVIAISDTDKKAPNDVIGRTLKDLIEVYERFKENCIGELFYSEDYGEVENLIPKYIYEMAINLMKDEIESYRMTAATTDKKFRNIPISFKEFLIKLSNSNREDTLRFFDFKKGLTIDVLRKSDGVNKYWTRLLSEFGISEQDLSIWDSKINIIENYQKRPINSLVKLLENESVEDLSEKIEDDKKDLWNEIGRFLYSWGCYSKKSMRTA